MSLYKSNEIGDWKAAYAKRGQYVALKEKKAIESLKRGKRKNKEELIANMKLVEFDEFLFNELRETIKNREDGDDYMTLAELSKIMKWKLFRGQFRPRLQALIDSNKNKDVMECTKSAFKIIYKAINKEKNNIHDVEQLTSSIKALDKLKGVGVATASLILSIYTNIIPFMADEVMSNKYPLLKYFSFLCVLQSLMAISPGSKLKYDKKTYLNYVDKLITKCEHLRRKVDQNKLDDEAKDVEVDDVGKNDEFVLTPFVLGECLWTQYMMDKYGEIQDDENKSIDNKPVDDTKAEKRRSGKRMAEDELEDPPLVKKRKLADS